MTRLWTWWHRRHGQTLVRIRHARVPVYGLPGAVRLQVTRTLVCPCGAERPR